MLEYLPAFQLSDATLLIRLPTHLYGTDSNNNYSENIKRKYLDSQSGSFTERKESANIMNRLSWVKTGSIKENLTGNHMARMIEVGKC